MPMYRWKCKECNVEKDIIRSFKEYDVPPTKEELGVENECSHPEWERMVGGPDVVRGPGWGKKGSLL